MDWLWHLHGLIVIPPNVDCAISMGWLRISMGWLWHFHWLIVASLWLIVAFAWVGWGFPIGCLLYLHGLIATSPWVDCASPWVDCASPWVDCGIPIWLIVASRGFTHSFLPSFQPPAVFFNQGFIGTSWQRELLATDCIHKRGRFRVALLNANTAMQFICKECTVLLN